MSTSGEVMVPMRWLRRVIGVIPARVMLCVVYVSCLGAGVGLMIWTPLVIDHAIGAALSNVVGAATAISAAVCLVAQLAGRWMVEWVALWVLGAATSSYSLVAWANALVRWPGFLVEACFLLALSAMLAARVRDVSLMNRELMSAHRRTVAGRRLLDEVGDDDGPGGK